MSWEQVVDIFREAAAELEADRVRPPEACPNDGIPLTPGPRGELHCSFDGWQYPRDHIGGGAL